MIKSKVEVTIPVITDMTARPNQEYIDWNTILTFMKNDDSLLFNLKLNKDIIQSCIKYLELCAEDEEKNGIDINIIRQIEEKSIDLWEELMIHSLIVLDIADYFILEEVMEKKYVKERNGELDYNILEGVRSLKDYLEDFHSFEYHLYASDKYYRDHFYHMLKFFFFGLYLLNNKDKRNQSLMDEIDKKKILWFCEPLTNKIELSDKEQKVIHQVRNAAFTIVALCHDLGYPIERMHKINISLKNILDHYPYLDFVPHQVVSHETSSGMIDYLLTRLSMTGQPKKNKMTGKFDFKNQDELQNGRDRSIPFKCKRAKYVYFPDGYDSQLHTKAHFSKLLADKNHGIISCLLLIDKLHRFRGSSYEIGIADKYRKNYFLKEFLTSEYILKPIAYHQGIDAYPSKNIYLLNTLTYFFDEVTENNRLARQGGFSITPQSIKVKIEWTPITNLKLKYLVVNFEGKDGKEKTRNLAWFLFQSFVTKFIRTIGPCINCEFTVSDQKSGFIFKFHSIVKPGFEEKCEERKMLVELDIEDNYNRRKIPTRKLYRNNLIKDQVWIALEKNPEYSKFKNILKHSLKAKGNQHA